MFIFRVGKFISVIIFLVRNRHLRSACPYRRGEIFFERSFGVMLARFNHHTGFTEGRCQSQEPEKSKKQLQFRQISTYKPETQWFCVHQK